VSYPPQPAPQQPAQPPMPTLSATPPPPPKKKAWWPYCLGIGCLVLVIGIVVAVILGVSVVKKRPEARAILRIAKETNCRFTGFEEKISNTEDKLVITLVAQYDPGVEQEKLQADLTKVQQILVEEGWTRRRQLEANVQGVNGSQTYTYTFNTADMIKTFGGGAKGG